MNIGQILLFTVNSILPLIILILIGYILKVKGFFTKEFLKIGNKTVFYVCLPVLLFKNIADIEDMSMIRADVIVYSIVIIALLILSGYLVSFMIPDVKQKGVLHQCVFRSNFALIGVPLSELIGGSSGIRVAAILSMFSIPLFNIAGVIVLSVYKGEKIKIDVKKIFKDIIKNPLILGVLSGIVFAVGRMYLADTEFAHAVEKMTFINSAIGYVSRAATPLALIILGGQFDFKRLSGYKKQLTVGVVGRNIFAPLLGVGVAGILTGMGVLDFGPEVFAALISLFATPVAVASAVMAEAMDNDGQLAGQLVVWTSLISMLSLFVVIALARAFGLL